MNKIELEHNIAKILCGKDPNLLCDECFKVSKSYICNNYSKCRISEKTEEQLEYVVSPINECFYLEACPGSGKTEVVGMKAAYEINKWGNNSNGIALLTFTNEATNVISNRINEFSSKQKLYPHYVGTVSGFIHSYIVQPFAYKLKKYVPKSNDYTFRLIDKAISPNTNPWLGNYKCKISYERMGQRALPIYGHQIYYDEKSKDYIIYISEFYEIPFNEYYNSESFQNKVKEIRAKNNNNWMYGYDYCFKLIKDCKDEFNKAGFANFEDMNTIALELLQNDIKIGSRLSRKFPVIIVDECQDLSIVELKILGFLLNNGSKLHFVGDLNQSIYEFKKVNPEDTFNFVNSFNKLAIHNNFRSCNRIVELSKKIISINKEVKGEEKDIIGENALLYLEYCDPKDAVDNYREILKNYSIPLSQSSIIVKQNTLKNELEDVATEEKHLVIAAIQYWADGDTYQKQLALKYMGKQVSKWLKNMGAERNYYCPNEIQSVFEWRIFLRDILCDCIKNDKLINFNRTNKEWYADARNEIPRIIKKRFDQLDSLVSEEINLDDVFSEIWYKAVDANHKIEIKNAVILTEKIKVLTVHGSKGCTFDSTLVISSRTTSSQSGHWKAHWLEGKAEDKRVGYVASTRAKYLLVWGVPLLSDEDKNIIESLGFINGDKVIKPLS